MDPGLRDPGLRDPGPRVPGLRDQGPTDPGLRDPGPGVGPKTISGLAGYHGLFSSSSGTASGLGKAMSFAADENEVQNWHLWL